MAEKQFEIDRQEARRRYNQARLKEARQRLLAAQAEFDRISLENKELLCVKEEFLTR